MTLDLLARMEARIIGIRGTIEKIERDLATGHSVDDYVKPDTISKCKAYEKHLIECLEIEKNKPLWDNLVHNLKDL